MINYAPIDLQVEPISLRNPIVMTSSELAAWTQISKNSVPLLVKLFDIRSIAEGSQNHRYSVHDVMRKIIGVSFESSEELKQLLRPLQKATWVARMTGCSVSAVNAAACEKRSISLPSFQMSAAKRGKAPPRSRRWIPEQIEAHLRGDPLPFRHASTSGKPAKTLITPASSNVFSSICTGNAEVSR